MNKKILVAALAVAATLLVASNAFAATSIYCTGGTPTLKFVGVGSSAQTNGLAYAASQVLKNTSQTPNSFALVSFGGSSITDSRASKSDTGLTTWVAYDPSSTGSCSVYVYYQSDSGVGVKDFFAYEKFTGTSTVTGKQHFTSVGAAFATLPALPIALGNKIPGLADQCVIGNVACSGGNDPNGVPSAVAALLNQSPEQFINANGKGAPAAAPAYCGNVSTVAVTAQFYCYFNAAGTDIRPEDALYATTRGLTAYNGIVPPAQHGGTLTGLGYGAGSVGCSGGTATVGCTIFDSFNQNGAFNVLKFALSGVDPIKSGTVPTYTTLSVGASPVVVIAGNEDSANFGKTVTDGAGNRNYLYNNINRQTLAQVFSGYTACLSSLSLSGTGSGVPLQVIEREPLSGTYNTMEFTGVRTQSGGPLLSTAIPNANADSGQEQFNDPATWPSHTGATDCTFSSGTAVGFPSANCFNPLFLSFDGTDIKAGSNCQGASGGVAPGLPVRLRAIGTGEEVKAVAGTLNVTTGTKPSTNVFNPIGYAFWSYGNLDPFCSAISGKTCTGSFLGHYLSVDGVDPLFATDGGEFDNTPNPSGAFNPPVCQLGSTINCLPIPFTHMLDGTYPLWSLLRTVTFAPVAGKHVTPIGVLDIIANEEQVTASNGLSDFVPFLNSVTGSNGVYTGNLNLFVFRSHFKQTGSTVNPANGHTACNGTFTGISLQGGNHTAGNTCLVDFGNDVGGAVIPVYKDVDFIADFGTEEYGIRQ
jgi:hypothetical protein